MRRRAVVVAVLAAAAGCGGDDGIPEDDAIDRAQAIVEDVVAERWDAVNESVDPDLRPELTSELLASSWNQVTGQLGAVAMVGDPDVVGVEDGLTALDVPLEFDTGSLEVRITLDRDGAVEGLYFMPGGTE